MNAADRLGEIARQSAEAHEQWDCGRSAFNADNHAPPIDAALASGDLMLAALRAVLDVCDGLEEAHRANPRQTYEYGLEEAAHQVRNAIEAALEEAS